MDFNRNFPWQRVNFCLLFCLSVHDNEFSKFERMMLQHTDPMFSQGFKNEIFQIVRTILLGIGEGVSDRNGGRGSGGKK